MFRAKQDKGEEFSARELGHFYVIASLLHLPCLFYRSSKEQNKNAAEGITGCNTTTIIIIAFIHALVFSFIRFSNRIPMHEYPRTHACLMP